MRQIFNIWILLQIFQLNAQAQNECASTFNAQTVQTSDPTRYNRYIQLEQHIANYISTKNNSTAGRLINQNSTIIIPVVVHVLHNGTAIGVGNNISDAQVISQIDVLNEDFRRLNADKVNTPAAFTGVASDVNIEFRLACLDPNGNNTNGINRVQTNINPFTVVLNANNTINEQASRIKFTAQGGQDAWPTDRYLNMWVCNIAPFATGQLLGYAQFPFDFAASPNTDGVVMLNTAFGRVGNLRFQFDRGRTTTHEVGHWLNLFHIWGDDGNACTGSDQCDDTPNQGGANQSNCPGFPNISCGNNPNGDMFMNYMDYTVDACKNIYTQRQADRMRAVFAQGGPRAAFIDNYFRLNPPVQNPLCDASTTISAVNPLCLQIAWSVTGPATISGSGNLVTINKTGNGTINVTATANGYTDTRTVDAGTPGGNVIGHYTVNGGTTQYSITNDTYQNLYVPRNSWVSIVFAITTQTFPINTWTFGNITANGLNFSTGFQSSPYGYGTVNKTVYLDATNICGTIRRSYTFNVTSIGGFGRVAVSPNPAKDVLNVNITKESDNSSGILFSALRQYLFVEPTLLSAMSFYRFFTLCY
jgi:hypothetical protein